MFYSFDWCGGGGGRAAKKYDGFLASATLIKQIPRVLGPGLNKAGKFPSPLSHEDNLEAKIEELRATIKFQMKKVLTIAVAIGHVQMSQEELVKNISQSINFLVSLLKKVGAGKRACARPCACGLKKRDRGGCLAELAERAKHQHQVQHGPPSAHLLRMLLAGLHSSTAPWHGSSWHSPPTMPPAAYVLTKPFTARALSCSP
jgi:hypothetical protein